MSSSMLPTPSEKPTSAEKPPAFGMARRMSLSARDGTLSLAADKRMSHVAGPAMGGRRGSLMMKVAPIARLNSTFKRVNCHRESDEEQLGGESGMALLLKDRLNNAVMQNNKESGLGDRAANEGTPKSMAGVGKSLMTMMMLHHRTSSRHESIADDNDTSKRTSYLSRGSSTLDQNIGGAAGAAGTAAADEHSDDEVSPAGAILQSQVVINAKVIETRRQIAQICRRMEIPCAAALPAIGNDGAPKAATSDASSEGTKIVEPREAAVAQVLRRVKVFEHCSASFLAALGATGKMVRIKANEVRDLFLHNPAAGIVVQSGSCRIEIGKKLVDECSSGVCFGLAEFFAQAFASGSSYAHPDINVRGLPPDGCRLLVIRAPALKEALSDYPEDHNRLRGVMRMIGRAYLDTWQHLLNAIQCGEATKTVVMRGATRHLYMPGEEICHEGRKTPCGLILVRRGALALEIGGVEVRRVGEGQVFGEEMLLGISSQWAATAKCLQQSDVVILHRQVFLDSVKAALSSQTKEDADERRDCQRLLVLLEGSWRTERVILSWPLFRGYDAEFLASLASRTETRVVLPGNKVWESGCKDHEVALYFLMHGTCDEATNSASNPSSGVDEGRKARRRLMPGATIAVREFLGVRETNQIVVMARTLALISVLHRAVYLDAVDRSTKELQSTEVRRLLKEELDRTEPLPADDASLEPHALSAFDSTTSMAVKAEARRGEALLRTLPLFSQCDRRLVDAICRCSKHRFCIAGQRLCVEGSKTSSMYTMVRGSVTVAIDTVEIQRWTRGLMFNTLALVSNTFRPTYSCTCEGLCELLALRRVDFMQALDSFTTEKRHFTMLLSDPTQFFFVSSKGNRPGSSRSNVSYLDEESAAKENTDACAACLLDLDIFEETNLVFLQWVQQHLEARIFFADEVIFREGDEDRCLYLVCQGTVILEGTSTQHNQLSLSAGACMGEECFLLLTEKCRATATVLQTSVLQIMHRPVFENGLKKFPEAAASIEKAAVKLMNATSPSSTAMANLMVNHMPLFSGCGSKFCKRVARSVRTKLVRRDDVVQEPGQLEWLSVLKSGRADEYEPGEKPRPVAVYQALGARQVLGLCSQPPARVVAKEASVFYQLKASSIAQFLNRHPEIVARICQNCLGVNRLWPTDGESVGLFKGIGSAFFDRLIGASEWKLVLPNSMIITQGEHGTSMFILCYGSATLMWEDITVGGTVHPGDSVGSPNFFRISDTYDISCHANMLCHVRSLAAAALDTLLLECPAEADRFEQLKNTVRESWVEHRRSLHKRVAQEKLKRRFRDGFQRHVDVIRQARSGDEKKTNARGKSSDWEAGTAKPAASPRGESASDSDTENAPLRKLWLHAPSRKRTKGRRANGLLEEESSDGESSDSSLVEGAQRIERAILEHTYARREEQLRGKVLRVMRGATKEVIDEDELDELDVALPVPAASDNADGKYSQVSPEDLKSLSSCFRRIARAGPRQPRRTLGVVPQTPRRPAAGDLYQKR